MGMDERSDAEADAEPFRELLRLFPLANIEDYFQNNKWRLDKIRIDTLLIDAHRKESGAPEPPPIEEVELPPLPGKVRPAIGSVARPPAKPVVVPPASRAVVNQAAAELKQISAFISKWKLDATKSKQILARLPPPKRRFVLSNFEGPGSPGSPEMGAAFEKYVRECDFIANQDDSEGSVAPSLKRPIPAGDSRDPKRAKHAPLMPPPAPQVDRTIRASAKTSGAMTKPMTKVVPPGHTAKPKPKPPATMPPTAKNVTKGLQSTAKQSQPKAPASKSVPAPAKSPAKPSTVPNKPPPLAKAAKSAAKATSEPHSKPGELIKNLLAGL